MSIERLIASWGEVRAGLMQEAMLIPAEQFSFRATPDTRSVAEILQHVVETEKLLVGEACCAEPNLSRQSFETHIAEYAPEVADISDKDGLMKLLRSSMEASMESIRRCGEGTMRGFDGKEGAKLDVFAFAASHEMYHRGQLTVYERLLGIEPALTQYFKKLFARDESGT